MDTYQDDIVMPLYEAHDHAAPVDMDTVVTVLSTDGRDASATFCFAPPTRWDVLDADGNVVGKLADAGEAYAF